MPPQCSGGQAFFPSRSGKFCAGCVLVGAITGILKTFRQRNSQRTYRAKSGVFRRSPARYAHINPYGKYRFNVEAEFHRKSLRPLRSQSTLIDRPFGATLSLPANGRTTGKTCLGTRCPVLRPRYRARPSDENSGWLWPARNLRSRCHRSV
jgi:hypothetical protein